MVQDEERLSVANTDWLRKYIGTSQLLLLPKNTDEVFIILQILHNHLLYLLIYYIHYISSLKMIMHCWN